MLRSGPQTAALSLQELVGRDHEFERLLALRRRAAEGHGSMVLLSGEAGIGKSRLLREFTTTVSAGRSLLGVARCVEFSQRPFGPLRESLLDILAKLSVPREAGNAAWRLADRLAFDRGFAGDAASPPRLFETIATAFEGLASRRTLVIALEDLHWADRSTLGYLAYLAERIENRRLMVVATYRSEEFDAEHPRLAEFSELVARPATVEIALGPLDSNAIARVVETSCPPGNAPNSALTTDIVSRSEGNAFFAEELLKSALLHDGPAPAALPLSLRGAVLARVAKLNAGERSILSLASVLGRRFGSAALASIAERPKDEVLSALQHARSLQLVVEDSEPQTYAFRHALTQEVIYAELLREQVSPIHERIGRELETRWDRDAVLLDLAHHWWHAGDDARAAGYCEASGDRAFAFGAYADGIGLFERALQKVNEPASRARLHYKVGRAFGISGQPALGLPRLRIAADLWRELQDHANAVVTAEALGVLTYNIGDVRNSATAWPRRPAKFRTRRSTGYGRGSRIPPLLRSKCGPP